MTTKRIPTIIDGDGHVYEDFEAIWALMPELLRSERQTKFHVFPDLDHLHHPVGKVPPRSFESGVNHASWTKFADEAGIAVSVLYPTWGLSYGRITNVQWARATTRAYNDWLSNAYLSKSSRFRGMGLIPLQDPVSAAEELRRIVTELGMCGAMLPSTGFKGLLGDRAYWPVYETANELGCALAIHGGAHSDLGLDAMNVFSGVHALGHPFGILTNFSSLTFNGVFEAFPNVRFGFMEAGVAWVLMALERFDGSYKAFTPYDPGGELLRLEPGEAVSDRLLTHLRGGRIFIGCEGEELMLAHAVKRIGRTPFVYSSDFPHEVNPQICRHEIEEILESPDMDDDDKEAILHLNAERLYGIPALCNA